MVRKHLCKDCAKRLGHAAFILGLASLALLAQPESAPRKKALVIGNEQYVFLSAIPAARAGASAIATALGSVGFDVTEKHDLTLADFRKVIDNQFIPDLKPGDVCLVYYSGYGLQRQETNYFVPVDFNPESKSEVYAVAYAIGRLQDYLNGRQVGLKVLLIEASWESTRLTQWADKIGLASPTVVPADMVLVLGTAPNTAIAGPAGGLGLFTAALLDALPKQGLTVSDIIQSVQKEVAAKSQEGQQIYPVGESNFYFIPPPPPSPPKVIVEKETWPRRGSMIPNRDHQEYMFIPAGKFMMGCVPSAKYACEENEKPRHLVEITKPFWLGKNEVEVEAYKHFARQPHRKMPNAPLWDKGWKVPGYPIVYVTWEDARDYCSWAGGRLPTEAEWEYAARAGSDNQVFPFPDMKQSRDKANFSGKAGNDIYDDAAPVRQFDPNDYGLYDMAGNVWEWVSDFYAPNYYTESPKVDPQGPPAGKSHVARGGSYDSDPAKHLRLSFRGHYEKASNNLGFRCLLPDTLEIRAQFKTAAGR